MITFSLSFFFFKFYFIFKLYMIVLVFHTYHLHGIAPTDLTEG